MKITNCILILLLSSFLGCNSGNKNEVDNTPQNGDLNKTFVESKITDTNTPPIELTSEQKFQQEKERLFSEGWEEKVINNGTLSKCYNFKPQKGEVDNSLEVSVGGGTDVAIKVMNTETDQCVRFVFINSGTTYSIENIPEGVYYLKIAYGKNWLSKVENGNCVGRFIRNPLYEKGEDLMDFNLKTIDGGYSVPSFKLQLDVISSDISNSFNSQNISESDFNQ